VLIAFACLFVAGIAVGWRSRPSRRATIYLTAIFVATAATLLLCVPLSGLFLRARHTLALLPIFLVGVAASVVAIQNWFARCCSDRAPASPAIIFLICSVLFVMTLVAPMRTFGHEVFAARALIENQVKFVRSVMRPGDRLIFGNPNSGATFVYYCDRSAFARLDGMVLFQGVDFFKFPPTLAVDMSGVTVDAFTLCRPNAALATASSAMWEREISSKRSKAGRVYFVNLPMNYFKVADPFRDIPNETSTLIQIFPGVYRLEAKGK
jgi:hypothetical protein